MGWRRRRLLWVTVRVSTANEKGVVTWGGWSKAEPSSVSPL